MGGLFDRYQRGPAYDEMFGADGLPHPHMRALHNALQTLTGDDLARRAEARDRSFRDQGIVFSHAGEEWIFPLDLIPRLIPAAEWELVEAGVAQRVRALEVFLADVYGPAEVVRDGVVPRSLLTTSAGLCRPAHGIQPPNGVRVHLAGIDIVRDQAGLLQVLEDNLQVPSGMSYVVENRRTMARVFPGLFLGATGGIALSHAAAIAVFRIAKLMSPAFTGLPRFLTPKAGARTGFATVQKTASALEAEIRHLAFPLGALTAPVADGVEDYAPMTPRVVEKTHDIVRRLARLAAIELVVAAQAIELRGGLKLGRGTRNAFAFVRKHVAKLDEDRATGPDFERLAAAILAGEPVA